MLGHRVFDMHHFDESGVFDYQDWRLFLQMTFLDIERDNSIDLTKSIACWLEEKDQPVTDKPLAIPKKFTGLGKTGFAFFSSVKDLATDKWKEQKFYAALQNHINEKAKGAKLITETFTPPPPSPPRR